jgi:hypothetical protein
LFTWLHAFDATGDKIRLHTFDATGDERRLHAFDATGDERKDQVVERKDQGDERKDQGDERKDQGDERKDQGDERKDQGDERKDQGDERKDQGDERKDQEVGILRFSTGPIKVTYAGLHFHLSKTIAWFLRLALKESKYELGPDQFYVEELFVICIVLSVQTQVTISLPIATHEL